MYEYVDKTLQDLRQMLDYFIKEGKRSESRGKKIDKRKGELSQGTSTEHFSILWSLAFGDIHYLYEAAQTI